ncbi:transporter [Halosolutus gelatinilyticus]|uniref:transporter n=1 Tax=Halosolutus gelatinilyticus TaxID=2931975 RepID=UPI001FF2067C|nr:transporter [Halosolutus gelatinilyticus]
MPPPIATAGEQSDPARLVTLAALAASHGLIRVTERYLPEFVVALGYGPIVVGALATLGLGIAAVAAERSTAGVDERDRERAVAALSALLAAAGLLTWTGAPTLDGLLGTPLSALGWLAIGVVLLQAWHARGPTRHFWPIDTRVSPFWRSPVGDDDRSDGTADADQAAGATGVRPDRRTAVVLGALGIAVAAVIATAAVAGADTVSAGIALVAAAGAAVALVGAVALSTVVDGATTAGDRATGGAIETAAGDDRSLETVRNGVSRLPDRRRWAVIGDGLVRVAIAGIAPFLVLLVVEYESIGLSIGGFSLAPAAVFGLFLLAEAGGAILGALGSGPLASRVDRRALLAVGLAVASLVPMALVAAPKGPGVVAALFALFGCRTAIEPLRPTVGASARAAPIPGSELPETVRTAVRIAVVPAPLIGGLLYAVDPLAAFTAATTVGLLGVRELGRAFTFGRDGDR